MGSVRGDETGATELGEGAATVANDDIAADEVKLNELDSIGRRLDADAGTVCFAYGGGIGIEETEARPAKCALAVVIAFEKKAEGGLPGARRRVGDGFGNDPEPCWNGVGRQIETNGNGESGVRRENGVARRYLTGPLIGPPDAAFRRNFVFRVEPDGFGATAPELAGAGFAELGKERVGRVVGAGERPVEDGEMSGDEALLPVVECVGCGGDATGAGTEGIACGGKVAVNAPGAHRVDDIVVVRTGATVGDADGATTHRVS